MNFSNIFTFLTGLITTLFSFSPEAQVPYIRMYTPVQGVYIAKINNAPDYRVEPYVAVQLTEAKDAYNAATMKLLINGGYFDPNNGKTASFVVIDKKIVSDPRENEALMSNEALKPYMDRILNRGEFRILKCEKGKLKYDIAYHNDSPLQGCEILHSIQAGPVLDSRMDLEKEYFLVKNDGVIVRDSISASKQVARSAIGLKENDIYLFVVTDEHPMTIEELSEFMKSKGMEKALAFDGGSSTSFENGDISITSAGDGKGRKVKSFLFVKK